MPFSNCFGVGIYGSSSETWNIGWCFGKGDFEISTLPVNSTDEIGIVTKAFNKMVVSIQDYIEKIRQSAETERELKEK